MILHLFFMDGLTQAYAHSKREAKRTSARLLDKVVGEA